MNNIQYDIRANPGSFPVAYSNWYPPVAVLEKNQQYVQILMAGLASTASEVTTVHRHLYQSWIVNDRHQNTRRVTQRIAIVEQHHFSIIGQLIHLLRGQPECRSSRPNSYWCGNMVSYSCELPAILSDNARLEQFAAQAYAAQPKETKDPHVSKILARLSLDEKLHYKVFSDYLPQIE